MNLVSKAKCPLCEKGLSHRGNLMAHVRTQHSKTAAEAKDLLKNVPDAVWHCDLCDVSTRDYGVHESSQRHLNKVEIARAKAKAARRSHSSSTPERPPDSSEDEQPIERPTPKRRAERRAASHSPPVVKRRTRIRPVESSSEDEADLVQTPAPARDTPPRPLVTHPPSVNPPGPVQVEAGGNWDSERLWNEFKEFTKPAEKGKRATTYRLYREKLVNFESFLQKTDPDFELAKCCFVGSSTRYQAVPFIDDWAKSFPTASNRDQAINAYKRFIAFLQMLLRRVEHLLPKQLRNDRQLFLISKHQQACHLARRTQKLIRPEKFEKQRLAAERAEMNQTPVCNYRQLKELVDVYRQSQFRKNYYSRCVDKGLKAIIQESDTALTDLRNWLACEVLIESFGQRPDTVKNMQVSEVFNAHEYLNKQNACISVRIHKTSSKHGPAQVLVPAGLWNLLKEFARVVRPMFKPLPQSESPQWLFLSREGKQLEDLVDAVQVFSSVANPPFNVTAMDFRRMASTLGQEHPDMHVRTSLPKTMAHSEEVARDYYRDVNMHRNLHLDLKTRLLAPVSGVLPKPRAEETAEDKAFKLELQRLDLANGSTSKRSSKSN